MTKASISDIVDLERSVGVENGPFYRAWLKQHRPFAHPLPRAFHQMPGQTFTGQTTWIPNTADFNARNTFTTEASLIGDTISSAPPQSLINQYCAIPANDPVPGRMYELIAGGIYGTTGTPTIIFTPRWGNNVTIGTNISLGASSTYTTASGVSAQPWFLHFIFTIRTAPPGATLGTGKGHGMVALGISAATGGLLTIGKTAATIDTSGQGAAGLGLQIGITWSASSASNTITPENYHITARN